MHAYVFPGQGAQFVGMGKDLYDASPKAKEMFNKANSILKFKITQVMFEGTEDDLKQTNVTQPAIFLHSVILAKVMSENFKPDMVAGHSLGEFSALVANRSLSFEDGLKLVSKRAAAMQKACEVEPSTMAAILGLDDEVVENICNSIKEVVVPANYNSPGQLVISGSMAGIEKAVAKCTEAGAKRALVLKVGGAFHSPLMEPARLELAEAINSTKLSKGICGACRPVPGDPGLPRRGSHHADPRRHGGRAASVLQRAQGGRGVPHARGTVSRPHRSGHRTRPRRGHAHRPGDGLGRLRRGRTLPAAGCRDRGLPRRQPRPRASLRGGEGPVKKPQCWRKITVGGSP